MMMVNDDDEDDDATLLQGKQLELLQKEGKQNEVETPRPKLLM